MPIDNIGSRPVASTDMAQYAAPAADKGNAAKTGSANGIERELTAPSDARDQSVALRNAAGNNLRGAAHAGRESFMEKVGRWVKEGFLSQAGLPDTVTLHMPDGTTVEYPGERLAGMVKALPRLERAEARDHLVEKLEQRLKTGNAVRGRLMGDEGLPPPGLRQVSDLILYLEARAIQMGKPFVQDAGNIPDEDGTFYNYLASSNEAYTPRASRAATLRGLPAGQSVLEVPGQGDARRAHVDTGVPNTYKSIDIPAGPDGLTGGRQALLFGFVPAQGDSLPRRIFLKLLDHGSRLNPARDL